MIDTVYDLREHQQDALKKLTNGKILRGGVGSGKSRVAAAYYDKHEAPKAVYVITTAKKRDSFDWREEFHRINVGPASGPEIPRKRGSKIVVSEDRISADVLRTGERSAEDRGRSESDKGLDGGGGLPRLEPGVYPWVLTVDSWNNIGKYEKVKGAFFIFDEQRLVGSGAWTKKFLQIAKNNNWILLSATPGDTWMDYVPVFVANNFYKNRSEFKREHVVYSPYTKFPKVERYINVGRLIRQRNQLLVEMPFERLTKRNIVEVPLEFDKDALTRVLKDRWNVYEDRPLRDAGEMFWIMRRVVNSDPSRLEMVKEIWKNHPKLIVFYNFNFELEALRSIAENTRTQNPTGAGTAITESPNCCDHSRIVNGGSTRTGPHGSGGTISTQTSSGGLKSMATSECPWTQNESDTSGIPQKTCSCMLSDMEDSTRPLGTRQVGRAIDSWDNQWTSSSTLNTISGSPKWKLSTTELERSKASNQSIQSETSCTSTIGECGVNGSETLTQNYSTSTSIAEWNGHRHDPIPSTNRWLYLVQYTAGAEGWNCIETDAMVLYSRNYSWKVLEQALGRIDRLNTPFRDLWYYDFTSESMIDRAIGRALKAKETFNEKQYEGLFK